LPEDTSVSGHDGDLIRRARERMVPRMSIREAARLTGDSEGNWGHCERGYQLMADGARRSIAHPPAPTLARMASVVGVTPVQLEEIGRGDAAAILREILEDTRREAGAVTAAMAGADEAFLRVIRSSPDLTAEQKQEYARMWRQGARDEVAEIAARMLRRSGDG
jgi:hypothetical protein